MVCARKDWLEHRYKVRLFAAPPAPGLGDEEVREGESEGHGTESEEDDVAPAVEENLQTRSCKRLPWDAQIKDPSRVNEFLHVDRYKRRWPMIPPEELEASSVRHPLYPEYRWLLHTRRVPMASAGVGDERESVWMCWDCRGCLCSPRPTFPKYALANDRWGGREHPLYQNLTPAT